MAFIRKGLAWPSLRGGALYFTFLFLGRATRKIRAWLTGGATAMNRYKNNAEEACSDWQHDVGWTLGDTWSMVWGECWAMDKKYESGGINWLREFPLNPPKST